MMYRISTSPQESVKRLGGCRQTNATSLNLDSDTIPYV